MAEGNDMTEQNRPDVSGQDPMKAIDSLVPAQSESDPIAAVKPSQPFIPSELLISDKGRFINLKGVISRQTREEGRAKRNEQAEDEFGKDVERIALLSAADEEITSTRFSEAGLPPQSFPDPEDLLNAYKDSPPGDKVRRKDGVKKFTETTIRGTLARLTNDIRILQLDQGTTTEDAAARIESLTEPFKKGKRRAFGQLSKDEQMQIIQDLSELRGRLLRENAGSYFYFIAAVADSAGIDREQLLLAREAYSQEQSPEKQVKIAADARLRAEKLMTEVMNANVSRLAQIESEEANIVPVAENLRYEFEGANLPRKGKIIETILERKLDLSLPHIHDIYRLRRILEHATAQDSLKIDPDEKLTDEKRLELELARIEELLETKIFSVNLGSFKSPLGEHYSDEMDYEIAEIGAKYMDPSLLKAFQRVKLLRTTTSDEIAKI